MHPCYVIHALVSEIGNADVRWKLCTAEVPDDVCQIFFLAYGGDFPWQLRQGKECRKMQNYSMGLSPNDHEWHLPLLVHMRCLATGTTQRDRDPDKVKALKKKKRAKHQERQALKSSAGAASSANA